MLYICSLLTSLFLFRPIIPLYNVRAIKGTDTALFAVASKTECSRPRKEGHYWPSLSPSKSSHPTLLCVGQSTAISPFHIRPDPVKIHTSILLCHNLWSVLKTQPQNLLMLKHFSTLNKEQTQNKLHVNIKIA